MALMIPAGRFLVKEDEPEKSDVILILMGSISDRVLYAADLYQKGYAPKIIMVEESMGAYKLLEERGVRIISNSAQCKNALSGLGVPSDAITIIPGDAVSTQQEAFYIREYLKTHPEIRSLLLVTSKDHSRRSSMIFRKALKRSSLKTSLIICPSPYTDYSGTYWWMHKEEIQTVLEEYLKMANFLLIEQFRL